MALKLNGTVFGTQVYITRSNETGTVTGYASHQRSKSSKQFYVEYVTADGRAAEGWFFEDQLTVV